MKQKKEIFKAMREFFRQNKDELKQCLPGLTLITVLFFSAIVTYQLTKPVSYSQKEITMYTDVARKIREEGINALDQSDLNSIKYIDISLSDNKISIQKKASSLHDAYILKFIGSDLYMQVDKFNVWARCIGLTFSFSVLISIFLSSLVYFVFVKE